MGNKMLMQLSNKKVRSLSHELEELRLIKTLRKNSTQAKTKVSDKYKGLFSKEDADSFNQHTQTSGEEWGDN